MFLGAQLCNFKTIKNFINDTLSLIRIMTIEVFILEDKNYRCPRCRSREKIIDHENSIWCMSCDLIFDKVDLEMFDEADILARSEKQGIIGVLLGEFLKD